MYDKWNIIGYSRDDAVRLCRSGLNPLVAVILASRGIADDIEIAGLTKNDASMIGDPFDMKDMDRAVKRVRRAIESKEHVTVYGDYDVDGITSSCLVADYLRGKGIECDIYIPERLEEGYGVKSAALETIRQNGVSLVITVDCGITAIEEAAFASGLGMDMVITDHHECGSALPNSAAAVDPKRPDCLYPDKGLAGVGVAFKLICAVEGPGSEGVLLERYGDLVATGTIADVMPVTGENRVYINRGIELIREGKRPGLCELCSAAGISGNRVTVTNIGFAIAPRINAAGRVGKTDTAVKLLLTDSASEAAELSAELCALNRERQKIEAEMFADALSMLEGRSADDGPVVLASDKWHQGVAGIVASKVAEKFGVPAVMICLRDGIGRGSCRSIEGFNLFKALADAQNMLLSFGGHEMAAGLTVSEEDVDALRSALKNSYLEHPVEHRLRTLNIDFEVIKPELLTLANVDAMSVLEPYGTGNPQPVLCMKNVTVESLMPLSEGKHTKMWVNKDGEIFECIYFSHSIKELGAAAGGRADIAFQPQVNEFRGRRSVQLYLVDFAINEK